MEPGRATAAVALAALGLGCAAAQSGRARVALRCAVPEAEVTVDGVPYGRVSDYPGGTGRQLLLAPGAHRIVVRAEGGARIERELVVGPEDALTVAFELANSSQGAARAAEPARGGAR